MKRAVFLSSSRSHGFVLEAEGALAEPVVLGHGEGEAVVVVGLGLEFGGDAVDEVFVVEGVFVGEHGEAMAEEAVGAAVLGDGGLASFAGWTRGFLGVFAVGVDLGFADGVRGGEVGGLGE
jgi:hypothetical protein